MEYTAIAGAGLGLVLATGCLPESSDDGSDEAGGADGTGGRGAGGASGGSGDGGMSDAASPPDVQPPAEDMGAAPLACPRVTARINGNHEEGGRHLLAVPSEDLRAGVEKTYEIAGMSAHSHTVTLTVEHFAALNRAEDVEVMSADVEDHTHLVRIRCAPSR